MASSPRRRLVPEHLVERRLALALALQLELALRLTTWLRVVAQAYSLLPCLALQEFAVGYQGRFRYSTSQEPEYEHPNLHPPSACMPGIATSQGRCAAPGIRPRSSYEMDRH